MVTIELLQQIGLNKYEAEAYYALLARGPLTGYEVGKYSQVPGSRSYEILERLTEKGLALVQPGDPPRYSAQEPGAVFERFRATMETTLTTLATSLASLTRVDRTGEFWVVRGRQNILEQVGSLIASAQETLDLKLPSYVDVAGQLARAQARGCHIFRVMTQEQDSDIVLLVRDRRAALVGTLTPPDSCQAVTSANAALLDALHGYFSYQRSPGRALSELPARSSQPRSIDWTEWEARKQRHLRSASNGNRVA